MLGQESKPHTLLRALGVKIVGTARTRDNLLLLKILAIALTPIATICLAQTTYCHMKYPALTINQCIAREVTPPVSATVKRGTDARAAKLGSPHTKGSHHGR